MMGKRGRILIENERFAALRLNASINLLGAIRIVCESIKGDVLTLLADYSITVVASVFLTVVINFEIDIVETIELETLVIALRSVSEYLLGV
jgi:hypothetical protein